MNYRHHFHAGNFADVCKHALLVRLIAAMQRKEKGFLFLDTHAGRGGYDLSAAAVRPDGRAREAEYLAGIARLWGEAEPPAALAPYLGLVRRYQERHGAGAGELTHYPGSPWLARALARPQDRLALCELRADDAEALQAMFAREPRVSVQVLDGYTGLRALLPPPEKRALVLIDPPFEDPAELAAIAAGLGDVRRRLPDAVAAVWYPITERAGVDEFLRSLRSGAAAPALVAELEIAGESAGLRMRGCGLLVVNPPWQIEADLAAVLEALRPRLQVADGAMARVRWVVPER